jgi:PAS domain-containing protein
MPWAIRLPSAIRGGIAKDGRTIDVSVTVSPMRDAEGRVIGASKIARDITARRQAEEALRKSEERFRSSLVYSATAVLKIVEPTPH